MMVTRYIWMVNTLQSITKTKIYTSMLLNGKHYGAIPEGCIVHHKDENKLNWNIENLELLTRAEHIRKHKNTVRRKGVKVTGKKDGFEVTFESIEQAAEFCGTYTACIQRIFNGKQYTANGWRFERV